MSLLFNFNSIFNDAAQPWQLGFQDTAAPGFTGLVTLHNTIGFYLIVISLKLDCVPGRLNQVSFLAERAGT